MTDTISQSTTGKIHITYSDSATSCNAGNNGLRTYPMSEDRIKHAANNHPNQFCKKCFTQEEINELKG